MVGFSYKEDVQELENLTLDEIYEFIGQAITRYITDMENKEVTSKEDYEKLSEEIHERAAILANAIHQDVEKDKEYDIEKLRDLIENPQKRLGKKWEDND